MRQFISCIKNENKFEKNENLNVLIIIASAIITYLRIKKGKFVNFDRDILYIWNSYSINSDQILYKYWV